MVSPCVRSARGGFPRRSWTWPTAPLTVTSTSSSPFRFTPLVPTAAFVASAGTSRRRVPGSVTAISISLVPVGSAVKPGWNEPCRSTSFPCPVTWMASVLTTVAPPQIAPCLSTVSTVLKSAGLAVTRSRWLAASYVQPGAADAAAGSQASAAPAARPAARRMPLMCSSLLGRVICRCGFRQDFPARRTTVGPNARESTIRSPAVGARPSPVVVWYNQPVAPAATHDPTDAPRSDVARVIAGIRAVIGTAKSPRAHQRMVSETGVHVERAGVVALAVLADRGSVRLSELAAALQVDISTASRQVRKLEDAGLVARTPDANDGRASLLALTEHGRDSQRRLREHWHGRMAGALDDFTAAEQAALADLVERFAAGL